MIVVPVTDWLPVVNTEPRATVTALVTVKLESLFTEAAFVPTIPVMLTAPAPAVRFSVCGPSTVLEKLMPPLFVVTAVGPPSTTAPVYPIVAASVVAW